MLKKAVIIAAGTLLSFSAFAAQTFTDTPNYSNVVVFGDSLSDASTLNSNADPKGNNYWIKSKGVQGAPITNKDQNTQQRSLWINDFITQQKLGPDAKLYPSSQVRTSGKLANHYNVDYAYASAETGDNYLNDMTGGAYPPIETRCIAPGHDQTQNIYCVPSVNKQVQLYFQDLKTAKQSINKNTLYIIWAGGNDIFDNVAKLLGSFKAQHKTISRDTLLNALEPTLALTKNSNSGNLSFPVVNITTARATLIAHGVPADHIVVINLPDLSQTPAAIQLASKSPALKDMLLTLFKTISNTYNTALEAATVKTVSIGPISLLPASKLYKVNELFNTIVNNAQKYGYNHDYIINGQDCIDDAKSPNPSCQGYLFFNSKHPTTTFGPVMAQDLSGKIN